jgi:outer membrane receptor for ferrienterochelin and colicin
MENTINYRYLFITLLSLFFSNTAFAQTTGTVKGLVKDATTQEAIIGGTVRLEGTTLGTQTDVDGSFHLERVPKGTYTLVISSVGYVATTLPDVTVEPGKTTVINTTAKSDSKALDEVVVRGVRRTNTEISVITEIRQANVVVSGISSEQIVKSQDRDAAEVVRRIPGVSIIDNRFIQVRGLSERYNTVWLNDVTAPSSETDKKAFSFDIVPSALLDRVLVFKDPSPELPGDFAGGLVKVYLRKPALDERSFTASYVSGYRDGTTFSNFNSDKGSSGDFAGFGALSRDLPASFPVLNSASSAAQRDASAHDLSNSFGIKSMTAMPDVRFNASYLDNIKLGETQIGSLTSLSYTNAFSRFSIARNVYDADGQRTDRLQDEQATNNVRLGIIQNFSALLKNGTKLEFRNLFNQFGRNQITTRDNFSAGDNSLVRKAYALGYQGRTTYTGQLAGTHVFNNEKTNFDWVAGYGYSAKNEPDLRRVAYRNVPLSDGSVGQEILTPAPGQVDVINAGRLYQKLNENVYTLNANGKHKLLGLGEREIELAAGTYLEYKKRDFTARAFGYSPTDPMRFQTLKNLPLATVFAPENVGGTGFQLREDINSTYRYTASNEQEAVYASINVPITPSLKLLTGARYERNVQIINTGLNGAPVNQTVTTNYLLPSANLSYNFTETSLLRACYGRSLNRPEFRESAPFYYYDFDFNVLNYGSLYLNPTNPLKVATIDNYDLRYEWYPTPGEQVHLGVFYKNFTNPIENVVIPSTNLAYSFANAPSAYSYGVELDVRKSFNFLDNLIGTRGLKNLTGVFNLSLIKSQVDLGPGIVAWDSKRALQGQSPYVVNTGLYYQNESGNWQASALYNVFGPRILFAGSDQYPDVIEAPRHTIDLSLTKSLTKRVALNLGVQDLLNQRVTLLQDFNKDKKYQRDLDPSLADYRRGTYTTIGVKVAF